MINILGAGSQAMPPVTALAVAVLVGVFGCERSEEHRDGAPATRAKAESVSVSGTVHCGPVRECRGDAFLVYTPIGGKVLMISPTRSRSTSWVRSQLGDGRPLTIHGLDGETLSLHHYAIDADQLDFDVPVARSEAE